MLFTDQVSEWAASAISGQAPVVYKSGRRRWLHGVVMLFALGVAGQHDALAQESLRIPEVHGFVLSGERVDLPAGLKGKAGVLVIGFTQGSREQVAAWGRSLAGDYRGSASVIYFEMAELEDVPRLLRGLVLKKIKQSVSPTGQATFLPLSDHEAEWKSLADFHNPDDAYLLVVDHDGFVHWKTAGPVTSAGYAELRRRINGQKPPAGGAVTSLGSSAHP